MAISSLWLLATLSFFLGYGVAHIQTSHQTHSSTFIDLNQTHKPSFHFQPSKNWMNDPNGPMRYKGVYHIFYQHNPKAATWSNNIVWGHSVSKDLVNWFPLQHALTPTKPYDITGCWSGSATMVNHRGKPVILYTGIDYKQRQTQNLAVPKNVSDPFLSEWEKSPKNPVMAPSNVNKINATSFRDPTTAWLGHDSLWRVIVGSQEGDKGMTLLFLSKDFVNWVQAKHPLYSAKKRGMWECPDFFPVLINGTIGLDTSINGPHIKHVLKVSLFDDKHDYYLIGTYDTTNDIFVPDKGFEHNDLSLVSRYDYGKFYASKTFYDDAKKRRVLWGWINESSVQEDDIQKGWSGIQAIPRTLWLHKSGKQLIQWPIVEIEKLRTNPAVNLHSKMLTGGTLLEISGVTAAQADVEISFEVNEVEKAQVLDPSWKMDPQILCSRNGTEAKVGLGPFGLLVLASKGLKEYTAVFFKVFRANKGYMVLMCSDQRRSSLNLKNDLTTYGAFVDVDPVHNELSLRSLIDHSVVESFGGHGKACITARVYPTLAINDEAHLHAFNNGTVDVKITRLSTWSMQKAKIN